MCVHVHACECMLVHAQLCKMSESMQLCGYVRGCERVCECTCVYENMRVGANSNLGIGERAHEILIQSDVIRICQPLGILSDSKDCSSCSSQMVTYQSLLK